jgi:hypothetical protein
MELLGEDIIYIHAKSFLIDSGWKVLAGQPPNGCDNLPVVEIKLASKTEKGSRGACKPDLIAFKEGLCLLVECKPNHSEEDAAKLRGVLDSVERVDLLYLEIQQRHLLERRGITASESEFKKGLRGALAHSGKVQPQNDLWIIAVKDSEGATSIHLPINKRRTGLNEI